MRGVKHAAIPAIAWNTVPRSSKGPIPALAAVVVAVLVALGAGLSTASVAAQQRHAVVVSDSILLGAEGPLTSRLRGAGWTVDFDGAVSRSTSAGAQAVGSHAPGLTDTLVVSLGANDAGNPSTFRARVDAVMAAAASVPHVYWITIREVRPYYAPANQVLRDAAARFPNLTVVDWHAASAGREGLTASDGLHLTPAGANELADLLAAAVVTGTAPVPAAPPALVPVEAAPVTAAPAADPAAAAPAPPVEAPTTVAAAVPTTAPPTRVEPVAGTRRVPVAGEEVAATVASDAGSGRAWWGLVLCVVLVGAFLLARRSSRMPFVLRSASVPVGPPPVSRAELRAARIAGAQDRHPTSATVPPVPVEPGPDPAVSVMAGGVDEPAGAPPSDLSGSSGTAGES